jgi:dihydroneopterin aldolase
VKDAAAGTDRIELRGLRAHGRHGVYPDEREQGQTFVVDLTLHLDLRPAAQTDDVGHTVHYGELGQRVVGLVAGEPVALIETLAQQVADVCLSYERVAAVTVTVHKPEAPVGVPFDDVSVTISRGRG